MTDKFNKGLNKNKNSNKVSTSSNVPGLDYDFSYNGKINFEKKPITDKYEAQLEKINNAVFLDGGVSLEPRLQEYLKRKIFYKRENIEPQIKLSKTYQITQQDRIAMRNFLNGKTNIYSKGNYNVTQNQQRSINNNNNSNEKFVFLADQLKGDKRVPAIDYAPNKYKNIKNIQTMGMFGEEVRCNEELTGILDSRDFMEVSELSTKYRQGDTRQQSPGQVEDRYKLAELMFNRPSRM